MSWGIVVLGKPSEIKEKVAKALVGSRNQSGHAEMFDAIEASVGAAFASIPDHTENTWGTTDRQAIVESNGHIDSNGATATLSIKTYCEYTAAPQPATAPDAATK